MLLHLNVNNLGLFMIRLISVSATMVALLTSLATASFAQSAKHTTTMSSNAKVAEYTFKPFGAIQVAVMIKDIGGKTAVCGMWSETERLQAHVRASNLPRRGRANTTVEVGDRRLIKGLGFMAEVAPEDFVAGTTVNCQVTNVPWEAGFARQKIRLSSPKSRSRS